MINSAVNLKSASSLDEIAGSNKFRRIDQTR